MSTPEIAIATVAYAAGMWTSIGLFALGRWHGRRKERR